MLGEFRLISPQIVPVRFKKKKKRLTKNKNVIVVVCLVKIQRIRVPARGFGQFDDYRGRDYYMNLFILNLRAKENRNFFFRFVFL